MKEDREQTESLQRRCRKCGHALTDRDLVFAEGGTYLCPKCETYLFSWPLHHEQRWPGHENEYRVRNARLPFGYIHLQHAGCENDEKWHGFMELVRLWVDSSGDKARDYYAKRFGELGTPVQGESRAVLGVKCLTCGYVNAIKLLLFDDKIYNYEGKPWRRQP